MKCLISVKKRPGRPPLSLSHKKLARNKLTHGVKQINKKLATKTNFRRGRPPGAKNRTTIMKEEIIEIQREMEKEFEEQKKKKDDETNKTNVEETQEATSFNKSDVSPVDDKIEITSTSVCKVCNYVYILNLISTL